MSSPPPISSNIAEFTVSELSRDIKKTMEDAFGRVKVRGEISGFRGQHGSGHAYFALKDDKARLEAVIWRGVYRTLPVEPEEGLEVIATGKVTTYPGSSKYQIVIEQLEPAGIGALMALLEERRKKLAAEGLFELERKRPLPYLPRCIGVVTSPTGAVIRDILHRLADRFPVHVVVWPVRVQGDSCGAEVAAAIAGFNALGLLDLTTKPDLLIVARGGGSLEDLWGFNDEAVVRAVAASTIPVISAVGHETDWTLIDHAADVRAPTPTGAAEIAVPVRSDLLASLDTLTRRLLTSSQRGLEYRRERLSGLARGLPRIDDVIALPRQRFDTLAERLDRSLTARTATARLQLERVAAGLSRHLLHTRLVREEEQTTALSDRLNRALASCMDKTADRLKACEKLLSALSYRSILERGFTVVRAPLRASMPGTPIEGALSAGTPIGSAKKLQPGAAVHIEWFDGAGEASISAITPGVPLHQSAAQEPPTGDAKSSTPKPRTKQRTKHRGSAQKTGGSPKPDGPKRQGELF